MAVGMVFLLSQGDVDMSVGAMYNLVAMCMARALVEGLPIEFIIPFGLLLGALLGFVNGALSIVLDIPMIIVTLGTISVYSGLSLVVSGSTAIANFPKDNWYFHIFSGKVFGVLPASVVIWVFVAVLGYILYSHTAFGRYICAIGANKQAARYAGININGNRLVATTLMGVICAIGSIGVLGFLKAADPSVGKGSELMVISSAIIGGTSIFGGSGTVIGALIGALIISVIRNGLVLLNVSVYWQGVVTGLTIIAAVALDYVIKRRRSGR
jgi:ribose transport system permease protein